MAGARGIDFELALLLPLLLWPAARRPGGQYAFAPGEARRGVRAVEISRTLTGNHRWWQTDPDLLGSGHAAGADRFGTRGSRARCSLSRCSAIAIVLRGRAISPGLAAALLAESTGREATAEEISAVLERNTERLMALPGVVGVGQGSCPHGMRRRLAI